MGLEISVWEVFSLLKYLCFCYLHKDSKSPAILQFITRYYNSSQGRGLQSISTGGKSSQSIGVQSISGSSQLISGKSQLISGSSQSISGSFQSISGSFQSASGILHSSGGSAGVEVGLWVFFISQRYGKSLTETSPGGVWRAGILEDLPEVFIGKKRPTPESLQFPPLGGGRSANLYYICTPCTFPNSLLIPWDFRPPGGGLSRSVS